MPCSSRGQAPLKCNVPFSLGLLGLYQMLTDGGLLGSVRTRGRLAAMHSTRQCSKVETMLTSYVSIPVSWFSLQTARYFATSSSENSGRGKHSRVHKITASIAFKRVSSPAVTACTGKYTRRHKSSTCFMSIGKYKVNRQSEPELRIRTGRDERATTYWDLPCTARNKRMTKSAGGKFPCNVMLVDGFHSRH